MELLFGKPQSKRSSYLQELAQKKAEENPFRQYWYIVPEQFTLQAQRELIHNHQQGLLNLEVLSFQRLVYRLQNELPMANRIPLKRSGKAALIYRILSEHAEEFPNFYKKRNSRGFLHHLVSIVTECYQYGIHPEQWEEILEKLEGESLKAKTQELSSFLRYYQKQVRADYFVMEDALEVVSQYFAREYDLSRTEIFVDGFYSFVPLQLEILSVWNRKAHHLTVSLPYPVGSDCKLEDLRYPSELYYEIKNTVRKLRDCNPGERESITEISEEMPKVAPGILKMERELFQKSGVPFAEPCPHIHLAVASVQEEEIRYIAEEILRLVHVQSKRFSDIAVLTGNLGQYAEKLKRIFSEYRLTYFLDQKECIKNHPLLRFMESGLHALQKGFRYEEWMRHLKNAYFLGNLPADLRALKQEEIDRLDIYALEHGLRGLSAYLEWELSPELRHKMEIVSAWKEQMKSARSFNAKLEALLEYLRQAQVFSVMERQCKEMEQQEDWESASEYRQVAEKVQEYFVEMREFMKTAADEISLADFTAMVMSGLKEIEYASAPPLPDQIVVGSLEHTRLSKGKVLFVMGAGEDAIPSQKESNGFFSDRERVLINLHGGNSLSMSGDEKSALFQSRFTIYMALQSATEEIYLSYCRQGETGPSALYTQIAAMFPYNKRKDLHHWWKTHQKVTYPLPTLHSFLNQHQAGERGSFYQSTASLLRKAFPEKMQLLVEKPFQPEDGISPKLAENLYSPERKLSISRLETFSACPYSHFLRYGIKVRPVVPYEAERVDMGRFLHKVMEVFFWECQKAGMQIYELPEDKYREILKVAFQQASEADEKQVFSGSARNAFLEEQLQDVAKRSLQSVRFQMEQGKLRFFRQEVRFRKENMAQLRFQTEDGKEFYLEGVIDRVDTVYEGKRIYFSVLDYKTSAHRPEYTAIYYGLQLQLLLYLEAGREYLQNSFSGAEAVPIGAAYFHMKNPMFLSESASDLPKEADFLKEMRLRGFFIRESMELLDSAIAEEGESLVVNARFRKDGLPYKNAMIFTDREMRKMQEFAHKKAEELAGGIWRGNVEARPYEWNGVRPCNYCEYRNICKIDIRQNAVRILQEQSKEAIIPPEETAQESLESGE